MPTPIRTHHDTPMLPSHLPTPIAVPTPEHKPISTLLPANTFPHPPPYPPQVYSYITQIKLSDQFHYFKNEPVVMNAALHKFILIWVNILYVDCLHEMTPVLFLCVQV